MKKIFTRFLKENNCYQDYINNANNSEICFYPDFTIEKIFSMRCDIIQAFNWKESLQGYEYWSKINEDWLNSLRIINK